MKPTEITKAEAKAEAKDNLLRWYPKGSTVFIISRHRTENATHWLSFLQLQDSFAYYPVWSIAILLGYKVATKNGYDTIRVQYNNGSDIVAELSRSLYGDSTSLNYYVL